MATPSTSTEASASTRTAAAVRARPRFSQMAVLPASSTPTAATAHGSAPGGYGR